MATKRKNVYTAVPAMKYGPQYSNPTTLKASPAVKYPLQQQASKAGQQSIQAYGVPGDLSAINASLAKIMPPPAPATSPPPQPLDARSLQTKLNSLGAGLAVDGVIGPKTRAAMAKYGMDQFGNVTQPQQPVANPGGMVPVPTRISTSSGAGGPDFSSAMSSLLGGMGGGGGGGGGDLISRLTELLGAAPEIPNMDINAEAQRRIAAKYGGQESAFADQLAQLAKNYQVAQDTQTGYGAKGQQVISDIGTALQGLLGQGQTNLSGIYDTAGKEQAAASDKAAQALSQLNQGLQGSEMGRMSALGIGDALGAGGSQSAAAQLLGDYQQQAGQNIQSQANQASTLASNKANALGFGQSVMNSAGRQSAQAQTDLQQSVQAALSDLGFQNMQNVNSVQGQQRALAQQKALDLDNMISELTQSQYGQQRDAYRDRMDMLSKFGSLDIQNQQVQNAVAAEQDKLKMALANLQADEAKARSDYDLKQQSMNLQYLNPLTIAKTQAEIDQSNASTDLTRARIGDLLNPQSKTGYQELLNQYYSTPQEGLWGATGAGNKFRDQVQVLINEADAKKAQNAVIDPYQQAYQQATLLPNAGPSMSDPSKLDLPAILRALQIYYKGR